MGRHDLQPQPQALGRLQRRGYHPGYSWRDPEPVEGRPRPVHRERQGCEGGGVKTYVFISSAGTRGLLSGYVAYSKMKVGVEDAIKELDFEQAIILRPGMIIGERETPKAPFLEKLIGNLHKISPSFQDLIGMPLRLIGSPRRGTDLDFRSGPEDHRKGGGGGCAPCAGGQGALQVLGPRAGRCRQVWQR